MPLRRALLPVLLLASLSIASFSAAQSAVRNVDGSCTEINFGPWSTYTYGINNAGDITGYFQNESGGVDGYVQTATSYETIIDYPGFEGSTQAYGINDRGKVVGTAGDHVFIYDIASQTFSDVDLQGMPNAGIVAINNSGAVAGTTTVNNVSYGYVAKNGKVKLLLPPNAVSSSAFGISRDGTVIGSASLKNGKGFYYRYSKGKYTRINNVPNLTGISPSATILVGNRTDQYGDYVGMMREGTKAFNFQCGETIALGVNDSGHAVGYYGYLGDEFVYGFIWAQSQSKP